jgi:hypothetical protein
MSIMTTMVTMAKSLKNTTIIFLDWDDTLFPTSWMQKVLGKDFAVEFDIIITPEIQSALFNFETVVLTFLVKCIDYGLPIIVTNSQEGWITLVAQKFMPRLHTALSIGGISTVSARSRYEQVPVYDPLAWKVQAFTNILKSELELNKDISTILSIGDAPQDQLAIFQVKTLADFNKLSFKTLKMAEIPTAWQLSCQLSLAEMHISTVLESLEHQDFIMNVVEI